MGKLRMTFCGALFAFLMSAAALAAPAGAHVIRHAPKHAFGRGTSTNWSGYAVDGSGATSVTASWTQPYAVNCLSVPNSWSSPWVGIDGDTSNTVEQIGTDSDCSGGSPTYYAWYEMYPKSLVTINRPVQPNDQLTATVRYLGSGSFSLTLADSTQGWTYTINQSSKKARLTSVEWIMEGPSSGNLTDFGSIGFAGASAVLGGQTVSPSSPAANSITMVGSQGVTRAQPSSASGGSFTDTWYHS